MTPLRLGQISLEAHAEAAGEARDLVYSRTLITGSAQMPIRTASLTHQIQKNGARLHLAMVRRAHSQGSDQPASEHEQALLDERRSLKEARAKRQAAASLPKPKAVKPVKEAKPARAPKPPKAAKPPKEAKAAKDNKPSRADKLAKKAENLEAAKKAAKKSAKT